MAALRCTSTARTRSPFVSKQITYTLHRSHCNPCVLPWVSNFYTLVTCPSSTCLVRARIQHAPTPSPWATPRDAAGRSPTHAALGRFHVRRRQSIDCSISPTRSRTRYALAVHDPVARLPPIFAEISTAVQDDFHGKTCFSSERKLRPQRLILTHVISTTNSTALVRINTQPQIKPCS